MFRAFLCGPALRWTISKAKAASLRRELVPWAGGRAVS